jgi:sterol desaturase/sphingolipid hydroxylase (fatty acid hydroxylase superfamily)
VAVYVRAFSWFYTTYLSFLTLPLAARLPEAARIVFAILLADLLAWFQHWLKHRVPWLWHFHAVHHSQREINLFTDFRFHFVEYLVSRPIVMIPLMMFGVQVPHIVVFSLLATWQTRFYHANIRSNLGFLRYIFVTPQSHRIHHSIEPRHADKNFGVMFSFWDRLFKTRVAAHDIYPKTGIEDVSFPLERQKNLASLLFSPLRQLAYPFYAIARSFKSE